MFHLLSMRQSCTCDLRRWNDRFILMRSFVFRAKREDALDGEKLYEEAQRLAIIEDALIPIADVLIDENMLSQFEQYKEVRATFHPLSHTRSRSFTASRVTISTRSDCSFSLSRDSSSSTNGSKRPMPSFSCYKRMGFWKTRSVALSLSLALALTLTFRSFSNGLA